jgi:large subunit ribosomal protein L4
MKIVVKDIKGIQIGTLEVSDYLFEAPMNAPVVHQAMVRQLANLRQGTSAVKTRAQVSGGGAKPRPQKGTGRARQGSIRAPHYAGGGVVFGPTDRRFRQDMPKKMRRLAIRCLLSDKAQGSKLTLINSMDFESPKTREMNNALEALGIGPSTLIITGERDNNVVLSARNLKKIKTLPASNINVLDLLNHESLLMTVEAVHKVEEIWAGGVTSKNVKKEANSKARQPARTRVRKVTDTRENTSRQGAPPPGNTDSASQGKPKSKSKNVDKGEQ